MSITAITLSDPARGISYPLVPNDAVRTATLEFTATVREASEDRAAADGALDTTQWLGAGAVTVELAAVDTVADVMDSLAAFLVPWSRPYLVVTDGEWATPRQVRLRFGSHAHPYEMPGYRAVQLAWTAPDGVWEDTAAQAFTVAAGVADVTGLAVTSAAGVAVTSSLGVRMPASQAAGSSSVLVSGTARPRWVAKLYGPCTGPKLTRDDTGQSLNFTDALVIAAGDYLELDSAAKSADYLSDPDASRLKYLDFTTSEWFPLDSGVNRLRYHATSGVAPGTVAQLTVRPVWMP